MSKGERLRVIMVRHRRLLRSQGRPVFVSEAERRAIDRELSDGLPADMVAELHGLTQRQVERQNVNRLFYASMSGESIVLSKQARRALESL